MKPSISNSRHYAARLAGMVLSIAVAGAGIAGAQAPPMPYALFQQSGIVATGSTISLTRVPVVVAAGTTIYKDITLQFDVDGNGNFALSSGFPLVGDSPSLLVSSIVPGNYVGPNNLNSGKNLITITGPGIIPGGVLAYSITLSSGANTNTVPSGGTIYVGPIENTPLADRLKKAGITSTAWSYGLGSESNCIYPYNWCATGLIGVSQIGNTLSIASFTGSTDKPMPVDQITYTLVH